MGQALVTIENDAGRGRWRLPWETEWRKSGSQISGLEPGPYQILFRPLSGFANPVAESVTIEKGQLISLTRRYRSAAAVGKLRIVIEPSTLTNSAWRLGDDEPWQSPGPPQVIPAGWHVVEFKPMENWSRPDALIAQVLPDGETEWSVGYLPKVELPSRVERPRDLVKFSNIHSAANSSPRRPFVFNGQLLSSARFASGFAVRPKVVITAAHAVFDDTTLEMVKFVDWFPQRHAGEYEPQPIRAAGWLVLDGYVQRRLYERTNGIPPRISSPDSQVRDVAALYFNQPVVRDGAGGYLVSSDMGNQLRLAKDTLLVGYPVEGGVEGIVRGRMHSLQVYEGGFSEVITGNWHLLQTRQFLSFPGNSGGPVNVLAQTSGNNSAFFPAGIYLGQSGWDSIVRVIDREVVALINSAATAALIATNSTGGGTIKPGTPVPGHGQFGIVDLTVKLEPPEAVAAGGAWRFTRPFTNAFATSDLATAKLLYGLDYQMEFKTNVAGFEAPPVRELRVDGIQKLTLNISYVRPELGLSSTNELWLSGPVNRDYWIAFRPTLRAETPWQTNWLKVTLTNSPQVVPFVSPRPVGQAFFQAILQPPQE